MSLPEAPLSLHSREQLLYSLTEAAEIEHNLMCCYLYAAWSLKTEDDDGLPPDALAEIRLWQRTIIDVAIDEMTHLALVGNLMMALGGAAHFNRPNFPIANGYLPAGLQVRLAPFTPATLQHFIHLERPEGSDEPDGDGFACAAPYERGLNGLTLMPAAQDYATVGHLYRSVDAALVALCERSGEASLFCGDPALQVGPDIVSLDGLIAITGLASARQAIATIIEQGEGAQTHTESGHFERFVAIRAALQQRLADDPDFAPAWPAAYNPTMRRPADPTGRVWVQNDAPRAALDLANALYNQMLRCLSLGFNATQADDKRHLVGTAIQLMTAIDPLARELARLRANTVDACNAGISFATLRGFDTPGSQPGQAAMIAERIDELLAGARHLAPAPRLDRATRALAAIAGRLGKPDQPAAVMAPSAPTPEMPLPDAASDTAEGHDIVLQVDAGRCIHARFCVTGAPGTFVANVQGPWLHPDETPVEALVEIAHACPSGAITYRRKDGAADEGAPQVNLLRLRENGPYAIHAPLRLGGAAVGFRATLCRCGASNNKPFCDGSHAAAGFIAGGEPATIAADPLQQRDGAIDIAAQENGPLVVGGNLEICSGTGRVINRVTTAKLCRCGHSGTKPFCDGSHRAAGFRADGL